MVAAPGSGYVRARSSVTGPTDGNGVLAAPVAVLEALPDAVVAIDRSGSIVFANAVAEDLFGYPRRQMIGEPVQKLWARSVRERYTRTMERFFASEGGMRYST